MNQTKTDFRIGKTQHIMIWASINGVTGNFIIDTGANGTCIGTECVEIFQMKNPGKPITAVGLSSNMQCSKSYGNTLQIGEMKTEADIFVLDLTHINSIMKDHGEKPIKGIIGVDILLKTKAVIDYGNMCLVLTQEPLSYKGYWITENDFRHPQVPKWLFSSITDCDEPTGSGHTIENCKEQIEDIIAMRE